MILCSMDVWTIFIHARLELHRTSALQESLTDTLHIDDFLRSVGGQVERSFCGERHCILWTR